MTFEQQRLVGARQSLEARQRRQQSLRVEPLASVHQSLRLDEYHLGVGFQHRRAVGSGGGERLPEGLRHVEVAEASDAHLLERFTAGREETAEAAEIKGDLGAITTYYGANFRHAAAPTKPVLGVVRDRDTKKPLAGVIVESNKLANNPVPGMNIVQTTTDAQGRYRLMGMPKGEGNKIRLVPRADQPYLSVHAPVPDGLGLDPATVDFALKRGLWVEGKSGFPVPA